MGFKNLERLDRATRNRYEAVIIAAQHARHLNNKRLAKLQQIEEGNLEVDIEARKITAVALTEVMEGKVNFQRSDEE